MSRMNRVDVKVTPKTMSLSKTNPYRPGFFSKYGGIDCGWSIYGGNHPHLLRNVF
jgi:hypothetical protein